MGDNHAMNDTPDQPELPEGLAKRPVDPKRGLPIPVMNLPPGDNDPEHADFTGIHAQTVYETAGRNLCGMCGEELGYRKAFVGGPKSFASRQYVDPPFHPECAAASLRLCPHMAIPRHKRAPEHRLAADSHTPAGFAEAKPEAIIIGITRSFKIIVDGHKGTLHFKVAPFTDKRVFRYVDDVLTEVDE